MSPNLNSTFETVHMSDEEELRRWAEFHGEAVPADEVLVDFDEDLTELGL